MGAEDGPRLGGARCARASPPPRLPPRQRATGRGSPAPARALPGFVEHQDIPQLIRALGYALSNEDLNTRLADAGIGETLEFEEYLLLVKALGKRPDRQVEIRELKEAIAMVTKSKDTVSESARNAPPPAAARRADRPALARRRRGGFGAHHGGGGHNRILENK